ncbi:MAG: amidase, partial [Pirellulaceae bacterium]|nr:amidase [Pirellulaceae bacterium]
MLESTIAANVRKVRDGTLDPRVWVDFYLDRIARHDDRLRAWVVVDEAGARRRATEIAEAVSDGGEVSGSLLGAPIGVKDIIDVKGFPTRAGSPLRENHMAESDAPLVARLRAAGAIILGKTVTTEFACFDPPPTKNPWNTDRTPGGSSSGSAAAVAVQMCAAAIGSQTGGSITRPASFCGVAGLKPTHQTVALDGVVPISFHLDHPGPIAGNVADLCDIYEAIRDRPAGSNALQRRTFDEVYRNDWPPPAIGVLGEFFEQRCDEDVRRVTRDACAKLSAAGAMLDTVPLPDSFRDLHARHRCVMAVDGAATHQQLFQSSASQFGPAVAELIREGLAASAVDYSNALLHQETFRRELH